MDPSESVKYIQLFVFLTSMNITKKTWSTSMVMSPAELSLSYATKGDGPKHVKEGGCDWSASGDRLMGKQLPGGLADTGQSH